MIMRSRTVTLRCPVTRKYDWNEFRISKAQSRNETQNAVHVQGFFCAEIILTQLIWLRS